MLLAHDLEGPAGAPAVVLLHSSVCDRRMWQAQRQPLLDAGFRVLALDFRGFGDTPAPTQAYSNVEDVLALLDEYGIEQAALVGASFGGRVAGEVAARRPERVSTLALVCAALRGHPPTPAIAAFGAREDELLEAGDVDAATALNVATFVGPRADEATRQAVYAMQRHAFEVQLAGPEVAGDNTEPDLSAITARTLVVSGKLDVDYFGEIAEVLTARIPGARHEILDWAGHLPNLEDPAAFNPVLLDFLRG
jgi:pimeloyl-ACP methyl ester carboxylesterase